MSYVIPAGVVGIQATRATFERLERENEPLPPTHTAVATDGSGMEIRLFRWPDSAEPPDPEWALGHGVAVLLPGTEIDVGQADLAERLMAYDCPDCSARAEHGKLQHADGCPIGLGIDEISTDDRRWFEARPDAVERWRAPHWAEVAELRVLGLLPDVANVPDGLDSEVCGKVFVKQLGPGIRTRSFDQLYMAIGHFGEDA